jgi:hypothetical protein
MYCNKYSTLQCIEGKGNNTCKPKVSLFGNSRDEMLGLLEV